MPQRSLVAAALVVLMMSACARAPRPAQTIPLDLVGSHPTALLTVGKHPPLLMIFDSGAGNSVIRQEFAKSLGLPDGWSVDVRSPGGKSPVVGYMTKISSARLGEADLEDVAVVSMKLPEHLAAYAGVIGPKAFVGRLVRFEFARSRVMVMDKTPENIPTAKAHPYGGERGHPLPAIELDVFGTKIMALLDSGSRYGLQLPMEFSKQVSLQGPLVPTDPVRMINIDHAALGGKLSGTMSIGPLTLTDPDVQFVEGVPVANVGIRILRTATLVLDPEDERCWLLPAD